MTESAAATMKTERASVWEDFIDIFYAPSQVFARRAQGSFWVPMLVVTVVMGVLLYLNNGVMQPIFDAEFNRGIAAAMRTNPRLTPEMAENFRQMSRRFASIGAFVFVPLGIFMTGTVLWIAGKLFSRSRPIERRWW
jgi:hypothetical protein